MRLRAVFQKGNLGKSVSSLLGLLFFLALCAAPLMSAGQPRTTQPVIKPRPSPTPMPGRPEEPAGAFPKIAETERGVFFADPAYLQRFSHPSSSLKVKAHPNKRIPRFDPLKQLEDDRRNRLELRPLLPGPETVYDPARGIILPEPKPTPLFGL